MKDTEVKNRKVGKKYLRFKREMGRLDFMNKSSTRGIFLSLVFLFSIVAITIHSDAYAEEIDVQSIALDETTIIELTNDIE